MHADVGLNLEEGVPEELFVILCFCVGDLECCRAVAEALCVWPIAAAMAPLALAGVGGHARHDGPSCSRRSPSRPQLRTSGPQPRPPSAHSVAHDRWPQGSRRLRCAQAIGIEPSARPQCSNGTGLSVSL